MKCVATLKDLWAAEQCNFSTNLIKVSQEVDSSTFHRNFSVLWGTEISVLTQRAEAGCYYKKKVRWKTLRIQKIYHKISNFY